MGTAVESRLPKHHCGWLARAPTSQLDPGLSALLLMPQDHRGQGAALPSTFPAKKSFPSLALAEGLLRPTCAGYFYVNKTQAKVI